MEDSPSDVLLATEALQDAQIANRLHIVRDGVAAIAFLRRPAPHADAPRPDLIFLDLNLPKKDGREVLAEIKEDPALRAIPVVVLTTSKAEEDVAMSYDHHANCYITKPVDLRDFDQRRPARSSPFGSPWYASAPSGRRTGTLIALLISKVSSFPASRSHRHGAGWLLCILSCSPP